MSGFATKLLLVSILVLAAATVTSCGPDYDALNQKSEPGKEYADLKQWRADMTAGGLKCDKFIDRDGPVQVSKKADCTLEVDGKTRMATVDIFPGVPGKELATFYADEYLQNSKKLGTGSGQILLGPNWTVTSIDAGLLVSIQEKLGGDIIVSK